MWDGHIWKFLQRFFGFWLSLVLKEIMVPGRSFNLAASKCLYRPVADPGEGPGGPPPPPYFWTKLWPEGPKKNFFLDRPTPLISGSGWPDPPPPTPLSEGLDPPMQVHYNDQVTFLSPLLLRSPRVSVVSASPLTSFPLRFNSSNWFCLRVMPFSTAVPIGIKLNTS